MNTILQKRIEEAADEYYDETWDENGGREEVVNSCHDIWFPSEAMSDFFIAGGTFALQNQWISVDEALPPYDENGISKEVIVRTGFNTKKLDRYFANCKEWEYSHKNVTHWMEIPSLKGGEE